MHHKTGSLWCVRARWQDLAGFLWSMLNCQFGTIYRCTGLPYDANLIWLAYTGGASLTSKPECLPSSWPTNSHLSQVKSDWGKMPKFLEGGLPSGEGESWEQKLNHAKEGCLIWHDALVWSLEVVSGFLAAQIFALKIVWIISIALLKHKYFDIFSFV